MGRHVQCTHHHPWTWEQIWNWDRLCWFQKKCHSRQESPRVHCVRCLEGPIKFTAHELQGCWRARRDQVVDQRCTASLHAADLVRGRAQLTDHSCEEAVVGMPPDKDFSASMMEYEGDLDGGEDPEMEVSQGQSICGRPRLQSVKKKVCSLRSARRLLHAPYVC